MITAIHFFLGLGFLFGTLFVVHDMFMLGFFGRKSQNYFLSGRVHGPTDREVMMFTINPQAGQCRPIEMYLHETIDDSIYANSTKKEFLVVKDMNKRWDHSYEDLWIFDVTDTPTTNSNYGNRYHRWIPSSTKYDIDPDGKLGLSYVTKDKIHELKMKLKSHGKPETKPKEEKPSFFRRFFKKGVVHLS